MNGENSQSVTTGANICLEWKKINSNRSRSNEHDSFVPREGQCCCAIDTKMFIFGGVIMNGEDMEESNELFCFDIVKCCWEKVLCENTAPPPRVAGALIAIGSKLYLFGGLNHTSGWLDDFYVFDTQTRKWSEVQDEGNRPSPRDKLQAVAIDSSIYVFGGFGPKASNDDIIEDDDDEEYEDEDEVPNDQEGAEFGWFNDLFVFDTVTKKWSQPMQMNLGVPTQRAAHAMCAVGKNLVIFGGRDTEARQNDLHIFNTASRKWDMELGLIKGKKPEPRSFHTITAVENKVVVLGGRGLNEQHFNDFNIFDLETKTWVQPELKGDVPCGRSQHSSCILGDKLVLFGGSSNFSPELMQCQTFHNDIYTMETNPIIKGSSL